METAGNQRTGDIKTAEQVCAREGCTNLVALHTGAGRPGRFCSNRCRLADYRSRRKKALPLTLPATASAGTKFPAHETKLPAHETKFSSPVTKFPSRRLNKVAPAGRKPPKDQADFTPGRQIAQARARLQLSQEALAEKVGVTPGPFSAGRVLKASHTPTTWADCVRPSSSQRRHSLGSIPQCSKSKPLVLSSGTYPIPGILFSRAVLLFWSRFMPKCVPGTRGLSSSHKSCLG
jgi:hypothetical protein